MPRLRRAVAAAVGMAAVAVGAGVGVGAAAAEERAGAPSNTRTLAGVAGVAVGGRTTPGGVELGGAYLNRLSDVDWFEAGASVTFGGGGAGCFRDRTDAVVCDHGVLSGFAAEASASVRRYLAGAGGFTPYARLGLAVRAVSFGEDEVRGVAVPVLLGAGVRAEVAGDVDLVAGGLLRAGVAHLGRGIGAEPHVSLAVLGGVEFALD